MASLQSLWETLAIHHDVLTHDVTVDDISTEQRDAVIALRNSLRETTNQYKSEFTKALNGFGNLQQVSTALANDIFSGLELENHDSRLLQLHKTAFVEAIALSQQQAITVNNQYHGPEHFLEAIIDSGVFLKLYGDNLTSTEQAATLVGMARHDFMYTTKSADLKNMGTSDIQNLLSNLGYQMGDMPPMFIAQGIVKGSPAEYMAAKYNDLSYRNILSAQQESIEDYDNLAEELAKVSQAILATDIGSDHYPIARSGKLGKIAQVITNADIFRALLAPKEGLTGSAKLVIEGDKSVAAPVKETMARQDNAESGLLAGLKTAYRNFHKFVVNDKPEDGKPYGLPLFKLCATITMQELNRDEEISIDPTNLQALESALAR